MRSPLISTIAFVLGCFSLSNDSLATGSVWKTAVQSPDGRGRVEIDTASIRREQDSIRVWLRFTNPHPLPIEANKNVGSRFWKSLIETDCATQSTRYLRTLLLASRHSKLPIAEDGPYESFALTPGEPPTVALEQACQLAGFAR
jgi:hypothetical protein